MCEDEFDHAYFRPQRRIRSAIHGADFTLTGYPKGLDWFRTELGRRYSVRFRGRLGPRRGDDKSIRILTRTVEWTHDEIRYDIDQRHCKTVIKQLGLNLDKAITVVTPKQKKVRIQS